MRQAEKLHKNAALFFTFPPIADLSFSRSHAANAATKTDLSVFHLHPSAEQHFRFNGEYKGNVHCFSVLVFDIRKNNDKFELNSICIPGIPILQLPDP